MLHVALSDVAYADIAARVEQTAHNCTDTGEGGVWQAVHNAFIS